MDYIPESSRNQQTVIFSVATVSAATVLRDYMQMLCDWCAQVESAVQEGTASVTSMVGDLITAAVVVMRRLAKELDVELPDAFGRDWSSIPPAVLALFALDEAAITQPRS